MLLFLILPPPIVCTIFMTDRTRRKAVLCRTVGKKREEKEKGGRWTEYISTVHVSSGDYGDPALKVIVA